MRLVIDTNVFLHYSSFAEADWHSLVGETDITMTIPETVIKELDQKKFEGATATIRQRAQDAISRIDRNLNQGPMSNGVVLELCPPFLEPDWASLRLTPTNPDHRIVAETLALKDSYPDDRVCLVTADLALKLNAQRLKIEVVSPPPEWKRELKDPIEKELEKVRRELDRVRERLPEVGLRFAAGSKTTDKLEFDLATTTKAVMTDDQIRTKLQQKRDSRMAAISLPALFSSTMFKVPPEEITRYEKEYDAYLPEYEKYLHELQDAEAAAGLVARRAARDDKYRRGDGSGHRRLAQVPARNRGADGRESTSVSRRTPGATTTAQSARLDGSWDSERLAWDSNGFVRSPRGFGADVKRTRHQ